MFVFCSYIRMYQISLDTWREGGHIHIFVFCIIILLKLIVFKACEHEYINMPNILFVTAEETQKAISEFIYPVHAWVIIALRENKFYISIFVSRCSLHAVADSYRKRVGNMAVNRPHQTVVLLYVRQNV